MPPADIINASVERNKSSHDNVVNASMSVGLNNGLRQELPLQPEDNSKFSSRQVEPELIERESIRRSVIKGLNWYDVVAILEQILLQRQN